ncbi:MAG: hypothetical protein ACRD7E_24060, partial [Bryobacteraceae bacterium]
INRSAFGDKHPVVGIGLWSYSELLSDLGRKSEARRFAKQGREIQAAEARRNRSGVTVDAKTLRGSR